MIDFNSVASMLGQVLTSFYSIYHMVALVLNVKVATIALTFSRTNRWPGEYWGVEPSALRIQDKRNGQSRAPARDRFSAQLCTFFILRTFLHSEKTLVGFYADDTAIAIKSLNRDHAIKKLNTKMNEIEDCCEMWKVAINASKSNILIIGGKNKKKTKKKKEKIDHKITFWWNQPNR